MTYYLTTLSMFLFSVYAGNEMHKARDNRKKFFLLLGMYLVVYVFWAVFVISYFM